MNNLLHDSADAPPWRPAARWRGVNLLGLFNVRGTESFSGFPRTTCGFCEEDFAMLAEWGFNFARLPLDYRNWCQDEAGLGADEAVLRELDGALALGRRFGVHVQLCLHRAPGYCILSWKKEPLRLQTDAAAQDAFRRQWARLARRFRGVPNDALSFNLLNEPSGFTDEQYAAVFGAAIDAIHAEDPDRFVVLDGNGGGLVPVPAFFGRPLVGQAMRGYAPGGLSHYGAHWTPRPRTKPVWPLTVESPARPWLLGPDAAGGPRELAVEDAPAGTWCLDFSPTDDDVALDIAADGRTVAERILRRGIHAPFEFCLDAPARVVVVRPRNNGAARFGALTVISPDGVRSAELGGWCQDAGLADQPSDGNLRQRFVGWDAVPPFRLAAAADAGRPVGRIGGSLGMAALERFNFAPWKAASDAGAFCFVGEFGCYNKTPHATALAWLEDQLAYFRLRGWGWCLWNLDGPFGFLDSARDDVVYERFRGHDLDRNMLEVLRRY